MNGLQFEKKSQIENFVKSIIEKAKVNNNKLNNEDERFIKELLTNHPLYEKKKGCGIEKIYITKSRVDRHGFIILRSDGSIVDFSWFKCIRNINRKKSIDEIHKEQQMDLFMKACKHAVKHDEKRYKLRKFVDKSFREIVNDWIRIFNIDIFSFDIVDLNDGSGVCYFKDDDISDVFNMYYSKVYSN